MALVGVLCFHFPELLTSREFRAVYTEQFARRLLLIGLIAAFVLGTVAILRNRSRRVALLGVGRRALAVLLGGATVHFDPHRIDAVSRSAWTGSSSRCSSRRWCSFRSSAMLAVRPLSPLRARSGAPTWRTSS